MKTRQSNIELLRIVLILMMLYLHFIKAIHRDTAGDLLNTQSLETQGLLFYPWILSVVMADAFVLISGWFGIRSSTKGLINLIFQAVFLNGLAFVGTYVIGATDFSFQTIKDLLYLSEVGWFFKSYLLLFLMAPALNAFIEKVSKKELEGFLLLYFTFLFVGGWMFEDSTPYMCRGYSPLSFFGLYLLARYLRLHCLDSGAQFLREGVLAKHGKLVLFLSYIVPLTLTFAITYPEFKYSGIGYRLTSYCSPFVIFSATALLLYFSKIQVASSKWINTLARSTFAVYLIQESPFFLKIFNGHCRSLFLGNDGIICSLMVGGYLLGVFIFCVLVDQLRIFVWKRIERKFFPA